MSFTFVKWALIFWAIAVTSVFAHRVMTKPTESSTTANTTMAEPIKPPNPPTNLKVTVR